MDTKLTQKLLPEWDYEPPPRVLPKHFWHFPKVPYKPGPLGLLTSAIEGYSSWTSKVASYCCLCQLPKGHGPWQSVPSKRLPKPAALREPVGAKFPAEMDEQGRSAAHCLPMRPASSSESPFPWGDPLRLMGEGICGPAHAGHPETEHNSCICMDAKGCRCVSSEGVIGEVLTSPAENSRGRK